MERLSTSDNGETIDCPSVEIAAYLDGELTADAELKLEYHLSRCSICTEELNIQKHLLNALDGSLTVCPEIPTDFTKRIVANAESGVSGLRKKRERLNAAFVCCALFFFVLFTLGSSAPAIIGTSLGVFGRLAAVFDIAAHLVYDISIGIVVIMRSLAGQPEFGLIALTVIVTVSLVIAFKLSLTRSGRDRAEIFDSGSRL